MKKRLLSFFLVLAVALYCAMSVFAVDTGVDVIDDPLSYYFQNQLLGTYKGTGVSLYCPECDYKVEYTGGTLVTCPFDGAQLLLAEKYGVKATPIDMKNAGSNVPPGGRNPKGYLNETGTPYIGSSGALYIAMQHDFIGSDSRLGDVYYCNHYNSTPSSTATSSTTYICRDDYMSMNFSTSGEGILPVLHAGYKLVAPIDGYYSVATCPQYSTLCNRRNGSEYKCSGEFAISLNKALYSKGTAIKLSKEYGVYYSGTFAERSTLFRATISGPAILQVVPLDTVYKQQTNITINNNTWNGNIYTDNSTNLTYIYPQYTTINEKNETVTNISNNPIIYNQESKQYYTYDQTTNNYYYISYNAPTPTPTPTPTPSPSPDPTPTPSPDVPSAPIVPDTQNLIVPKMNANSFTDDHGTWIVSGSSKYSDVFDFFRVFDRSTADIWETNVSPSHLQIEIPDPENYYIDGYIMRISKFTNRYAKEWTLQGSDDGNTWHDLDKQTGQNLSDMEEHKYTLTLRKAYKYYRLNMSNYASSMCSLSHFNLLGYAAKDVTFPTPDPGGSGGGSGTTPTPTPAPTPGGSGDTNNFWNIIIKDNNKTDKEHKGIFWALVSLLIAAITFVVNMLTAYKYLFPFLPDGVIAVINTCVAVLMIFVVIKFVMRVIK